MMTLLLCIIRKEERNEVTDKEATFHATDDNNKSYIHLEDQESLEFIKLPFILLFSLSFPLSLINFIIIVISYLRFLGIFLYKMVINILDSIYYKCDSITLFSFSFLISSPDIWWFPVRFNYLKSMKSLSLCNIYSSSMKLKLIFTIHSFSYHLTCTIIAFLWQALLQ